MSAVLLLLPTLLALVAEAAWIAVVAAVLQAFTLNASVAGFWWFLAAASLGLVAARVVAPRAGERWPAVAAVLAVACGLVAWLASPVVRSILVEQGLAGIGDAIATGIGAWLVVVAFVRGIAHARLPADPRRIGNLLGIAIPGLAATAIVGGMVAEPWRSTFLGEAQEDVLVFLVAGVLALALARLGLVSQGAAVDWRRNPAWVGLLVVLLLATAVIAIGASAFAGPVIVTALGALAAPLLIVGFFVGFNRRSLGILGFSVLVTAVLATFLQLFATNNATPPPPNPGGGLPSEPPVAAGTSVTLGVLGVVIAVAIIAVLILARLWLRRPQDEETTVPETRTIDRGDSEVEGGGRRRRWLLRRRAAPTTAVTAYRALLADLEGLEGVERHSGETPAEHAARLRAAGQAGLPLDLLAADYALAQFAGLTLSAREERRAIRRASLLRRQLRRS
jgi:hypothetical protein